MSQAEPTVANLMLDWGKFPVVAPTMMLKQAMEEMGRSRLGIVCIAENGRKLAGILTDGDIRRKLLKVQKPFSALFSDDVIFHAIRAPVVIRVDSSLRMAVDLMEAKEVWDLPVVDDNDVLVGLLHLPPVVQALMADQGGSP
jgi:DeoR family transcriptional regulator, catabolite repression regulator